jgi:hypothetical protein
MLAFSISHDHSTVRVYGHYPIIDGKETTYYRPPIRKFDFTELEGKEKWTAFKFITNVYNLDANPLEKTLLCDRPDLFCLGFRPSVLPTNKSFL